MNKNYSKALESTRCWNFDMSENTAHKIYIIAEYHNKLRIFSNAVSEGWTDVESEEVIPYALIPSSLYHCSASSKDGKSYLTEVISLRDHMEQLP